MMNPLSGKASSQLDAFSANAGRLQRGVRRALISEEQARDMVACTDTLIEAIISQARALQVSIHEQYGEAPAPRSRFDKVSGGRR